MPLMTEMERLLLVFNDCKIKRFLHVFNDCEMKRFLHNL